jgi:hypothetical protein
MRPETEMTSLAARARTITTLDELETRIENHLTALSQDLQTAYIQTACNIFSQLKLDHEDDAVAEAGMGQLAAKLKQSKDSFLLVLQEAIKAFFNTKGLEEEKLNENTIAIYKKRQARFLNAPQHEGDGTECGGTKESQPNTKDIVARFESYEPTLTNLESNNWILIFAIDEENERAKVLKLIRSRLISNQDTVKMLGDIQLAVTNGFYTDTETGNSFRLTQEDTKQLKKLLTKKAISYLTELGLTPEIAPAILRRREDAAYAHDSMRQLFSDLKSGSSHFRTLIMGVLRQKEFYKPLRKHRRPGSVGETRTWRELKAHVRRCNAEAKSTQREKQTQLIRRAPPLTGSADNVAHVLDTIRRTIGNTPITKDLRRAALDRLNIGAGHTANTTLPETLNKVKILHSEFYNIKNYALFHRHRINHNSTAKTRTCKTFDQQLISLVTRVLNEPIKPTMKHHYLMTPAFTQKNCSEEGKQPEARSSYAILSVFCNESKSSDVANLIRPLLKRKELRAQRKTAEAAKP